MLDRRVPLEHLLRLAADQTDEVIRADRTAHRHGRLGFLLCRGFDLSPNLGQLAGNCGD
jgi:hypothetical protein